MEFRIEHDSMGDIKVPADRYWGAQTQRSCLNFRIGVGIETMPPEIIHAFGVLKQAAARANHRLLPAKMTEESDLSSRLRPVKLPRAHWTGISLWWYGRPVPGPSRT